MTNIQKLLIESLTSDLIMKVHQELSIPLLSAMRIVYNSDTFRAVCDTETRLYQSSAIEIFSILDEERRLGKMTSDL